MMLVGAAMFTAVIPIAYAIGNGARVHFASGYHASERIVQRTTSLIRSTVKGGRAVVHKVPTPSRQPSVIRDAA